MANMLVGQSGGPTSVINASLAGLIAGAVKAENIENIYGMHYGIEGFMQGNLIDLQNQAGDFITTLKRTPSSILGSSRYKLKDDDLPGIMERLKKHDIRYLFMIGGNDTMDTINRIELFCRKAGYELMGIGVPKTVDNDLYGTDHTPGFPSAARSNMLNVLQAGLLARDMQKVDKYVIYQTIGRDAGWLAAASAAGMTRSAHSDLAPHLIYMPERPFVKDQFLKDAVAHIETQGWVSIVCGEGIKYADGTPVSASETRDKFGNVEFGAMGGSSVALNLHRMLSEATGYRGEFQITESLIMSAADRAVNRDIEEAFQCGTEAVKLALSGTTGYMITMNRLSDSPYEIAYGKALLTDVAVRAKPMPDEYINEAGNGITPAFLDYIQPLMGDIPDFAFLNPQSLVQTEKK